MITTINEWKQVNEWKSKLINLIHDFRMLEEMEEELQNNGLENDKDFELHIAMGDDYPHSATVHSKQAYDIISTYEEEDDINSTYEGFSLRETKSLSELIGKGLDAETFYEYLKDYSEDKPDGEYGYSESDLDIIIKAFDEIKQDALGMTRLNISQVKNSNLYKSYINENKELIVENYSKVKIYLQSVGDYSTFDLLQLIPIYDVTNDIALSDVSLQDIKDSIESNDYDYKLVDAIIIDNQYYFTLD